MAIEHGSGPLQVLAGPGSGKTYLTIRRIRHLICRHGISPEKILVITFTKAAAAEMEQRFRTLTEGAYKEVKFGTFHAVYYHILMQSGYGGGRLSLATGYDQKKYLQHILNMYGLESTGYETIAALLRRISAQKNGVCFRLENEDAMKEHFSDIFKEYCRIMEEENKLDFDDMILLCDRLLEEQPYLLAQWQNRFSHILVDEFQDISPLQYGVIRKLAAPENNLFVVGDDDQSVYSFRGAGPDIMRGFLQDYPDAVQLSMGINYRCPKRVVEAAALVIGENKNRFQKKMEARKEETGHVCIRSFSSMEEERDWLKDCLRRMPMDELSRTAVIYRFNAQASDFARSLAGARVPFCIREKTDNIFQHDIALDLLSYLQFARDLSEKGQGKRGCLLRILNRPCRCIQRAALSHTDLNEAVLLEYYAKNPYMQGIVRRLFSDLRKIAVLRPYLAIDYIRRSIGYDAFLSENKGEAAKKELTQIADTVQQTALSCRTLKEWLEFIACYEEGTGHTDKNTVTREGVKLVTMHGSKGLEYDTVFLPCMNAGSMPSPRAAAAGQTEEERRLFYVAMTRARQRLEILYHQEPSPFLHRLQKTAWIGREGEQGHP